MATEAVQLAARGCYQPRLTELHHKLTQSPRRSRPWQLHPELDGHGRGGPPPEAVQRRDAIQLDGHGRGGPPLCSDGRRGLFSPEAGKGWRRRAPLGRLKGPLRRPAALSRPIWGEGLIGLQHLEPQRPTCAGGLSLSLSLSLSRSLPGNLKNPVGQVETCIPAAEGARS